MLHLSTPAHESLPRVLRARECAKHIAVSCSALACADWKLPSIAAALGVVAAVIAIGMSFQQAAQCASLEARVAALEAEVQHQQRRASDRTVADPAVSALGLALNSDVVWALDALMLQDVKSHSTYSTRHIRVPALPNERRAVLRRLSDEPPVNITENGNISIQLHDHSSGEVGSGEVGSGDVVDRG